MKILLVNKFFFKKGGAEQIFFETGDLLIRNGQQVMFFSMCHPYNFASKYERFFVSNIDYEDLSFKQYITGAINILYSFEAKKKMSFLLNEETPDIAHLHNIYHQISPSILHVLKERNIPVVMSLHDLKMVCASYSMLYSGKVCEACKGGKYYRCFLKGCVKDSRFKSLLSIIEMYLHHTILDVYDLVDVFISPSRFLKEKLEDMGVNKKIVYIPNFVKIDQFQPQFTSKEKSIVYCGRLSREKGIDTLIDAVKGINIKLKIIGDGPLRKSLEAKVCRDNIRNVDFLGYKKIEELKTEIEKSMFVVLPSELYENNPLAVIEAFAMGKPVVGSRIGGIPELVKEDQTGLTFLSGDSFDLRNKIKYLINRPDIIEFMGRNARKFVEEEFSAERHYMELINLYKDIIYKKR